MQQLKKQLQQIDGKSYKGYKQIQGTYSFQDYKLHIDYVQGDPFAAPSKIRLRIPDAKRTIKKEWTSTKSRRIFTEDIITRQVAATVKKNKSDVKGSGKSGNVGVDQPGQEVLERTAVMIEQDSTVICLTVGLPANGRRINGKEAEKLFFDVLPSIVSQSIMAMKDEEIEEACELADQYDAIREEMKKNEWEAFIADGSILPRESGISQRPMKNAVPFESPEENRVSISIPHRKEPITGMAIKKGITLIVGGGYHGKSTLLQAIERGVYPHKKGDGREYVITDPQAVKVRAEDGRKVSNVDISSFIKNLPHGTDTSTFTTEDASGSTSQAANVVEALEVGASALLIDEDTSATNFMIRDERMQELVAKEKEPITPFIDKIEQMRDELGVSTILVMGGSGEYFHAADHVIMMDQYVPHDVTGQAKDIASRYPSERKKEENEFGRLPARSFLPATIQAQRGKKDKVQAKGLYHIIMGRNDIQIEGLEQLVDPSQTRFIADLLAHMNKKGMLKKKQTLKELVQAIDKEIDAQGLSFVAPFQGQHPGELARPRPFEIAATLNRIRTARVDDFR
ncbi:ABC-ATPase domain-containing protein [Salimicrobium halophilum]|uniref:Predicted ATPase of the ABC class n=1 Tax=Salimicrobium halophilum TaxID=86666 RepID=A0A1G8TKR7_9BACI|nr:ABC-ATPase domain-containing protein [Salimicrobium halophilum]SDJ41260.1 Predicted ATPase of the ABC class [Salimicrobium halophilum]